MFFAALLPVQFKQLPLTLGLMIFGLTWLITLKYSAKFQLFRGNLLAIIGFAYYLWVAIGFVYSGEPLIAERILMLKVPFGAWAILLTTSGFVNRQHRELIIKVFVYALLLASLFAISQSAYSVILGHSDEYFTSSQLLKYYPVPPHYFGMYLNFAYGLILAWFLRKDYLLKSRWLSIFSMALILGIIILLSVRMQFVVFLVVNILVVLLARKHRKGSINWRFLAIPVLLLVAGMVLLPGPRRRMLDSMNEMVSFKEMVNNKQTNPRKFLWRDGVKVIQENFMFGTGTGAEDVALHEKLKLEEAVFWDGHDTYTLAETSFNYHNTYLQNWAANGLIGLSLLLLMLFMPVRLRSLKTEELVFLVVCAISFVTESMLQRQAGVLFFSFFYGVFFFLPQRQVGTDEDQAA